MTDNTEERIWAYMLKNRDADIEEIMLNTDASSDEVVALVQRIGSPNWRDEIEPAPLGGVKFDQGKPRYDLIPPEIEEAIAKVLTFGAAKYTVEPHNVWDELLYAPLVTELRVTTPKGGVVSVTRNTSASPIPTSQSANVRIVEHGKPETQIESASWLSVESLIQQRVNEMPKQKKQGDSQKLGSPRNDTTSSVPRDALSVGLQSTCTLTIATKQGDFEVSFAPDAITDSGFWTTVWKDLSVRCGISNPQRQTGERNWEKGMNWGRAYAALRRHMGAWWGGENCDPETGMPHTWHAACCIAFLVAFEARGTGNDDRPKGGA